MNIIRILNVVVTILLPPVLLCAQENTALLCSDGIDNDGDGLIDCFDSECIGLSNNGCVTCLSNGISFADYVIDYSPECAENISHDNPQSALGVSDFSAVENDEYVSLGFMGSITLGFNNNLLGNSGDNNADIWIFEVGPSVEPCRIDLRPYDQNTIDILNSSGLFDTDGDGFFEFGNVAGATSSLDIDVVVPGYSAMELKFDAVKITDIEGNCFPDTPGADIDAVCALSSVSINCQENTFVRIIGDANENEEGYTIIPSEDGNYYVGAVTGNRPFILKMTKDGDVLWERAINGGSVAINEIDQLLLDSENKLIISGRGGETSENRRGFVIKYDQVLDQLIWMKQLSSSSIANIVIEPEDATLANYYIIMGGTSFNTNPGNADDPFYMKLDKNTGALINFDPINYNLGVSESYISSLLYGNELYTVGRFTNLSGVNKMRFSLTKMNLGGQIQWSKLYHIPQDQNARLYGVDILLESESLIMVGTGDDNGSSIIDVSSFVFKTDLQGNLSWIRKYALPTLGGINAREIVSTPDGFIFCGVSTGVTGVFYLIKTDKEGVAQWAKSYQIGDGAYYFYPQSQLIITDSYLMFIASSIIGTSSDVVVVKTDLDGNTIDDCIQVEDLIVNDYYIENPNTTDVYLNIYDSPFHLNTGNATVYATTHEIGGCVSNPCEIDTCFTPVINLGDDMIVCKNTTLELNAGSDYDQYEWFPSDLFDCNTCSQVELTINEQVTIVVLGEQGNGCSLSDTININVYPEPVLTVDDITICEGSNGFLEALTNLPDEVEESFQWLIDGEVVGENQMLSTEGLDIHTTTEVILNYSYGDDCETITQMANILVVPNDLTLLFSATPHIIFAGDSILLSVEVMSGLPMPEVFSYTWFQDGVEIAMTEEPSLTVLNVQGNVGDEVLFSVEVTDENGCVAIDETTVGIQEGGFEIPNVFTPNGDGVNDIFKVFYTGGIDVSLTRVYDRWGQKIFESNNNQFWDGTYKGKPAASDVYLYEIIILKNGETLHESGEITLLR